MIAAERRESGRTVVEPGGPWPGAAGASGLLAGMRRIFDGAARRIAVDPGNVAFMDSRGQGALAGCRKDAGEGGTISLRHVGERVMTVSRLTPMDRVFILPDGAGGNDAAGRGARDRVGHGPGHSAGRGTAGPDGTGCGAAGQGATGPGAAAREGAGRGGADRRPAARRGGVAG